MNPGISPEWFSLSKSEKSTFFKDIEHVLIRLLKDGDIEEKVERKYIADNPLKIIDS